MPATPGSPRAVHAAVNAWGEGGALRLFTRAAEARSVSVTAIEVAPGIDPEALRSVARERFQVADRRRPRPARMAASFASAISAT